MYRLNKIWNKFFKNVLIVKLNLSILILFFNSKVVLTGLSEAEIKSVQTYNEHMPNWMNTKIDPCTNFIEYACGNFDTEYKFGKYVMKDPSFDWNTFEWLHESFNFELTEAEIKTKQFYEQCLKNDHQTVRYNNDTKPIKNWPILENEWDMKMLNWIKPFDENYSFLSPLIYKVTGKKKILITAGFDVYTSLNTIKYQSEIEEIQEVMKEMGVKKENVIVLTNEIVNFSKKFVNELKMPLSSNEANSWYDDIKLKDLIEEFPIIDWKHIFDGEWNSIQINDETSILILDSVRTRKFIQMILEESRSAYNYLSWQLIKLKPKMFCNSLTSQYLMPVILRRYAEDYVDTEDLTSYSSLLDMFVHVIGENIKSNTLNVTERELDKFYKNQLFLLNHIILNLSVENINKKYDKLIIDSNSLDKTIENIELISKNELMPSCKLPKCVSFKKMNEFLSIISYQHSKPFHLIFSYQLPKLLIQLANENFEKFFNSKQLEKFENCFKSEIRSNQITNIDLIFDSKYKALMHISAMKQSYEIYQKFLNKNDIRTKFDEILNEFVLNSGKVFFINFAQNYCAYNTHTKMFVTEILGNMKDFAKEFNCTTESNMIYKDNCFKL